MPLQGFAGMNFGPNYQDFIRPSWALSPASGWLGGPIGAGPGRIGGPLISPPWAPGIPIRREGGWLGGPSRIGGPIRPQGPGWQGWQGSIYQPTGALPPLQYGGNKAGPIKDMQYGGYVVPSFQYGGMMAPAPPLSSPGYDVWKQQQIEPSRQAAANLPAATIGRLGAGLNPRAMEAMTPSEKEFLSGIVSSLGMPPEDFFQKIQASYPGQGSFWMQQRSDF